MYVVENGSKTRNVALARGFLQRSIIYKVLGDACATVTSCGAWWRRHSFQDGLFAQLRGYFVAAAAAGTCSNSAEREGILSESSLSSSFRNLAVSEAWSSPKWKSATTKPMTCPERS